MSEPKHVSIALAIASFDIAFRHLMEMMEKIPDETPDQSIAGAYAVLFVDLIHRDSIVDEPAALVGMATVAGMAAQAIGGPALVRRILETIRQGSMIQYQQGLRSAKAEADSKSETDTKH